MFRYLIFYKLLRNSFFSLTIILLAFAFSFRTILGLAPQPHLSDFYSNGDKVIGMRITSVEEGHADDRTKPSMEVFALDGSDGSVLPKSEVMLNQAEVNRRVPFIKLSLKEELNLNDPVAKATFAKFDSLLTMFRQFQRPLFLQPVFADHNGDATTVRVYEVFKKMIRYQGASNVNLVWYYDHASHDSIPECADLILIDEKRATESTISAIKNEIKKPILLVTDSDHVLNPVFASRKGGDVTASATESEGMAGVAEDRPTTTCAASAICCRRSRTAGVTSRRSDRLFLEMMPATSRRGGACCSLALILACARGETAWFGGSV